LGGVVEFVRGKMAEKAEENAAAMADAEEESVASDRESEEGGGERSSPVMKTKSPKKKKKVTSAGMQIPEHWPWEEAKKLFIKPDVVKGEELEVSARSWLLAFWGYIGDLADSQVEWKAPDTEGLVEFLCRDKGFK